ncbi:DUF5977 domain-containing protein [Chitinophaga vietnamensis]|uniref:DUF5977 domain-containing protein n=1 Tax=Chitinophaga vietnamensis TaxID=2593957 RepID=UPI001177E988|nr:DUF5977 domain-containing protein [Chitinophaga vietnamensis]
MKVTRLIASAIVCLLAVDVNAQVHTMSAPNPTAMVGLPQLIPASPEPSAFVKSGVANVNMSTGALSASIPLYDIKIKDFTFPIALSYSTQGLKVDEASSRTGYGWILNATGMITRTVKGQPDELTTRMTIPADFNTGTDAVYNYCVNASAPDNPSWDSQADEFMFNVNGYTGKFVLDSNKIARVTAQHNIKVDVSVGSGAIGSIVMTTPDGIKYKFGTAFEVTTTHNVQQSTVFKNRTVTAFFLDRVDLPTGEYILFSYSPIHTYHSAGISQTLQQSTGGTSTGPCPTCASMGTQYVTQTNTIEYNTQYLSGITTSTGLNISLGYEPRKDSSHDNRLNSLVVGGLKNYSFSYYDLPSGYSATGRFFLTKVKELGTDGTADSAHNYVFTYDHMEETPVPMSFSQDYLGFFNGKQNSALIPAAFNGPNNTMDFSYRNPDWTYARKGTLIAIQYPTGGREEYTYEANTVGASQTIVPGVRIKQIRYTDPITFSTHSKYYTYAALSNLNVSTGSCLQPVFKSASQTKTYCNLPSADASFCDQNIYSSNTTQDVYNYAGSGSWMYYDAVIESDDPNFKNGGIEYAYFSNDGGSNYLLLWGSDVPYLSAGQFPTLSGVVSSIRHFDSNKQVVREEGDVYEMLIDMANTVPSVYVRRKYASVVSDPDRMSAFDVLKSFYNSTWIRLKTKTVKTYDGTNALTEQTNYTYGSSANILPATVITTDSKNNTLKTDKKYPTDFPTDPNYSKLVAKNMITDVVQESYYVNDSLFQQRKTSYRDWFGDSRIVKPEIVQVKESPSDVLHDRLVFSQYDNTGNPLQLKKADDMSISYVWDSVHALPVAEVKNATVDQIAFTNFKSPVNYGSWQLGAGGVSDTTGLFTGTLTKNISTAGVYSVNAWATGGVTVNGAGGTLVKTSMGTNYYEWTLTNPSTVTVQGTNLSELRLCPQNAMMSTYTYQPFVGVTSVSDEKGKTAYYFYDGYSRLYLVKDQDYNVLKSISYLYAGSIPPVYFNAAASRLFTRNCSGGMMGSSVLYTVPANKYGSVISQADADQQAQNDIAANGQNYADANGICAAPVSITCSNMTGQNDFYVQYTNTATNAQALFSISSATGTQALGTLPAGTYNVVVSKQNTAIAYSISVCATGAVVAPTATFTGVTVSPTACNNITLDLP